MRGPGPLLACQCWGPAIAGPAFLLELWAPSAVGRNCVESGKVRAAGLDVYASEPAKNKALYSHPMVSCTPHIGASTVEAQKRIGQEIVDIITKQFNL